MSRLPAMFLSLGLLSCTQPASNTAPTGTPHPPQASASIPSVPAKGTCHIKPYAEPDPTCTPGALNPQVTEATMPQTICRSGWTATVRPSVQYTDSLKVKQIAAYGYQDQNPSDYEEDHLIPLELGGNPTDPKNLWPQPHSYPGQPGSTEKDHLENYLKSEVCTGRLHLAQAQQSIATDWYGAWLKAGKP